LLILFWSSPLLLCFVTHCLSFVLFALAIAFSVLH
jgi:hypothetical protein